MILEIMIMATLWTRGGATESTLGSYMTRGHCLGGYKFTVSILWESQSPSSVRCAAMCAREKSCVTFTFDGSTCRGHSTPVTSVTPSATPFTGARTFVKREAVPSYVLSVQSPAGYGYGDPVQFPANVNISAMSKLCFSVRVCHSSSLSLKPDLWTNSTRLLEVTIGGWNNVKSVIRDTEFGTHLASKSHSPLSCTEYRRFYVSWETPNTLEVGSRQDGLPQGCLVDEPFMSYTFPQPFSVTHVFLTGWEQEAPSWEFHGCLD